MSNNWIDQMSQQMEHHEVEAPEGLWAGIEQGMEARKRGRRARLVWAWRAGAAAAVVAGVVVGVQMWNAPDERDAVPMAQTERPEPATPAQKPATAAHAGLSLASARQSAAQAHTEVTPLGEGAASAGQSTAWLQPAAAPSAEAPAPSAEAPAADVRPNEAPSAEADAAKTATPALPKDDAPLLAESKAAEDEDVYLVNVPRSREGGAAAAHVKHAKRRVSLQLMAMATGEFSSDYDADIGILPEFGSGISWDSLRVQSQRRALRVVGAPSRSYGQVKYPPIYSNHDYPVKFGLTLRVPLGRRFALDGGLSYARMRSNLAFFTPMGRRESNCEQQVNYLGVPVALSADLWRNRWWSVYASAGGEVAKSVKTTWRTAQGQTLDVAERPWQCSVSAAVGVQLNVTRRVGLYAQPSADYYFDNHSAVQTYYTDHPLVPALRMGVRVNL